MRVSLIQTESNGTKQENEKKIFKQLSEALQDKPDVICLSELFLSWGKDFYGGRVKQDEIKKYQDFAKDNIYTIGRYGAWIYNCMEDSMLKAKELAEKIIPIKRHLCK